MKITRSELSTRKKLDDNRPIERHCPGGDFKTVLDDSINRSEKEIPTTRNTLRSNFVPLVGMTPFSHIEKTNYIEKIEIFLNTLDLYHQKLGDQVCTLKDIAPVVDNMTTENEILTEIFESVPDNDELKQIISQALIISSVEIAKYNRGDYLYS